MIYAFAINQDELDRLSTGIGCPGLDTDFFFETSNPKLFDKYDRNKSVFYPYDGGKFFETHEEYYDWLKKNNKTPYPENWCFPVSFMPIAEDNVPEYTIEWISKNLDDFSVDWVDRVLRYKYTSELDKRIAKSADNAIENSISVREELLSLRKIVSILLNDYMERRNGISLMSLDEECNELLISNEDNSTIEDFLKQTEQVNAAVEAVNAKMRGQK